VEREGERVEPTAVARGVTGKLRHLWGRQGATHKMALRFGVTTADQCVASLSNFVVGVAVARLTGVAGFGAYSLVYTGWLILASVHRAVVTDPMAIANDLRMPNAREHVRLGLAAELCLGLAAGVIFAVIGLVLISIGQYAFGVCFLCLAQTS
jgi:O-antigen/teichoic acid export membrane protein